MAAAASCSVKCPRATTLSTCIPVKAAVESYVMCKVLCHMQEWGWMYGSGMVLGRNMAQKAEQDCACITDDGLGIQKRGPSQPRV